MALPEVSSSGVLCTCVFECQASLPTAECALSGGLLSKVLSFCHWVALQISEGKSPGCASLLPLTHPFWRALRGVLFTEALEDLDCLQTHTECA